MPLSRRSFLRAAGAFPWALAAAPAPKRILILGGTGFLGPATVAAARARGHQLTLFNRGKTRPGLFPDIETLHGDRDPKVAPGLSALQGRRWDAVIDNSAFFPRLVRASAALLAPNVKQYILISSISAYAANDRENADETAALATTPDPTVEQITNDTYGPLKALCESAAQAAMPGRVAVVRPGFIVGPDDPSGRFTYYPVRADRGGPMLAPGSPSDPLQFIDVRDLGAWLIRLVEEQTTGVFNATGPAARLTWGAFLDTCASVASSKPKLTWIPPEFIERQKLHFPLWVPYAGDTLGFHTRSIARALAAGLRFRPARQTAADTLAWYQSPAAQGRARLAGPTPEQESAAFAALKSL